MTTMHPASIRAAFLAAPGQIEVGDFPVPDLRPGDVFVRMLRASICGSDLHVIYDGFGSVLGKPGYPGHEGLGEVLESRSERFHSGQLVLTVPQGLDGTCFADHQIVGEKFLVPLPDGGDLDRLLMAQQLGTTIYAMRKFWPQAPEGGTPPGLERMEPRVATVIGAGSAGLFFLQQVKRLGFETVIVSDLNERRLQLASELGADEVADGSASAVVEATLDRSAGRGADLVIEAAGYDLCRAQAIEAVRARGRVGCFGYPEVQGLAPFPVQTCFRKAPTIEFTVGTQREEGLRSFHEAVKAIEDSSVEVDYCLGARFSIEQAPQAIALAQDRGPAVKVGIDLTV
ncbi:MAG: zinc-binding dehydrogenase [Candidatus Dormiibacterota bacterium]